MSDTSLTTVVLKNAHDDHPLTCSISSSKSLMVASLDLAMDGMFLEDSPFPELADRCFFYAFRRGFRCKDTLPDEYSGCIQGKCVLESSRCLS